MLFSPVPLPQSKIVFSKSRIPGGSKHQCLLDRLGDDNTRIPIKSGTSNMIFQEIASATPAFSLEFLFERPD
jgi:hypothetical protein